MPVTPLYQDPFSPKLLSSPALLVTMEQKEYIKKVLDRSSSDSRFSDKAYVAITAILTGGSVKVPTVSGLTPTSAVIGSPNFDLLVNGTNFDENTVIVFNGSEEVTTYVSATQVKTGVNMATATTPVTVPVLVKSSDGVLSNAMSFAFTSPALMSAQKLEPKVVPPPPKPVEMKK
jgi:hypothetical protein